MYCIQLHVLVALCRRTQGAIDVKRDAQTGRKEREARTAASSGRGKCFTAVAYSPDGECVLAGGRSKFVCIYAVEPRLLVRKYQVG